MSTNESPFVPSKFIVLEVAHAAVVALRPALERVASRDRDLADQTRRAAQSMCLNLSESRASRDGNRRLRLRTALGSAEECITSHRLAYDFGYVVDVAHAYALLSQVARMTTALLRT
jgi:four helix bundle protein